MSNKYLAFDLETGIKQALKRKASPFYGVNQIWAVGYRGSGVQDKVGFHRAVHGFEAGWFRTMLMQCKLLVGFNIKFDLLHALLESEDNYNAWVEWVDDGGMVWDCQLIEYLIEGMDQKWHMCSMDETAPKYGGNLKDDAVKACWNNGIDTPDIDPDMLMDYLMGTNETDDIGDIGNTELIFKGQLAIMRERGAIASAMLNNGGLMYTVEAELNGMKIDSARAETLRVALVDRLAEVDEKVQGYIPKDLPFEFSWTSRYHKSALLFGGSVRYDKREQKRDENGELAFAKKKEQHVQLVTGRLVPASSLSDADYATKVERYAGGAKKGQPKTKMVDVPDLDKPKMHTVDAYYEFDGFVEPLSIWKSNTEGVYSTKAEVIEELGNWVDAPPFIKEYALRQKLSKDLSTYYWVEDEDGNRKGMLALLGPDGIIHHQLNMVNTVTARLSSSDPNLQNLPKGDKSDIKSVFISRFPGGSIVQSDFTSLEVYVQANLSLDAALIADLRAGLDMHCVRVGQKLKEPYESVVAKAKNRDHPEYEKYHKLRTGAKTFSFQRAYGAGAAAIAKTTGMTVDDIKELIEAEEIRYPGVTRYNNRNLKTLQQNRKPGVFVQHDHITGLSVNLGKSYFTTPDGKRYVLWESCAPKFLYEKDGTTVSFKPTTLKNYPVQGMGGEWAKAAMWLLLRALYRERNFGQRALLVNQVHDAVYADVAEEVRIKAMALIHACMEEASVLMEQHFNWKVAIPVPTETVYGASMLEELGAPKEVFELVPEYRKQIRTRYLKDHVASFEQEK